MNKTVMFGDAKYIITNFNVVREGIFTFKERPEAERILKELQKQFPEEDRLTIEDI